jgi:hypothetical protein
MDNKQIIKHNTLKRSRSISVINENCSYQNIWNSMYPIDTTVFTSRVSASKTKNFLMNDGLLDWLEIYYCKLGFNNTKKKFTQEEIIKRYQDVENKKFGLNVLMNNGICYEEKIYDALQEQFNEKFVKLCVYKNDYYKAQEETLQCMKQGIPIIAQASLINDKNGTFGTSDLLVRSDYINKIVKHPILSLDEINIKADNLTKYHYRVIDIKWTSLPLCANGINILNSQRMPSYKGQLAVYNCALGLLQGYYPPQTYILSKGWSYSKYTKGKREVFNGYDSFDRLGVIDYSMSDNKYIKLTFDAINWYRRVQNEGHKWNILKPGKNINLYPNMKNDYDEPWHNVKTIIAHKINELTKIYNVSYINRNIAVNNGYSSWKTCKNTDLLGIPRKEENNEGCASKQMVIQNILSINQQSKDKIRPALIDNDDTNWQEQLDNDYYLDFETIESCLQDQIINIHDSFRYRFVFLIGLGYNDGGKWKYKHFCTNNISLSEEQRIFDEFNDFIESRYVKNKFSNQTPEDYINSCKKLNIKHRFFHWGNAETSIFNEVNARHNGRWNDKWLPKCLMLDINRIFYKEPIIIKGAFNFKLKEIVKAMTQQKLINVKWDNEITSGLGAMFEAIKYYDCKKTGLITIENKKMLQNIIKYNEVDCRSIYEIVKYLRKNHT